MTEQPHEDTPLSPINPFDLRPVSDAEALLGMAHLRGAIDRHYSAFLDTAQSLQFGGDQARDESRRLKKEEDMIYGPQGGTRSSHDYPLFAIGAYGEEIELDGRCMFVNPGEGVDSDTAYSHYRKPELNDAPILQIEDYEINRPEKIDERKHRILDLLIDRSRTMPGSPTFRPTMEELGYIPLPSRLFSSTEKQGDPGEEDR